MRKLLVSIALAAGCLAGIAAQQARADDLVIGLRETQSSTDPHFMTAPAAFQINSQTFDPLVLRDNDIKVQPSLATSWEIVNDTTWLFHLRKDVKFHDGSPFTAEDVAFTYRRAANVPNTPTGFRTYLGQVKEMEIVDPYTLKIMTDGPAPSLLEKLSYVLIVSKKHGEGAATEDYHSGKAMIGTGPYKFVSWQKDDRTIIEKNPGYWGPKPTWDKITYRMMLNDSTRVAALLSGDIDIAEAVASQDVAKLASNPEMRVWKRLTTRFAYITFDVGGGLNDGRITGPNGEKLDKNPLADPKVRQALIEAIDIDAMTKRLYGGEAEATAQYLTEGTPGYDPGIKLINGNPERGRKLLEEAGVVGKFKLSLPVGSAFFPQSVQAAEAIAQLWTRAGIPTSVEAMPMTVWLPQSRERKFAVSLSAYQNSTGSADNYYPTYFHTKTPTYGSLNGIGYSNPKMDSMIEEAMRTMNNEKRAEQWKAVTKAAIEEKIFAPLFFFYSINATKKTIAMKMRVDRAILPANITRVSGAAK